MALGRGFASGFLMGVQGARLGLDAYNQAKDREREERKRSELEAIADAKPEELSGFTAEQGDQLRAAAESGQYDIGYDETKKSYTVTPKADPTQTGVIAQQGVTDFLGKRSAGSMSQEQQDSARQLAMAGVLTKYDPQEGMRIRREVKAQEREDQRWNRENEDRAKLKEYEEGRKAVFSGSRFGAAQNQYQQQMTEYQSKLEKYEADKAAGKSGPELGLPPVAPTRPEYSIGDSLADRAALIDHDAKHGKLDSRTFGEFTDLLNKVQTEGYEKVLRLAQSGAPIQEVAKAFNSTGKAQFDPALVVSDKVVKGKDGVETRVIQYKDPQGNTRTINTVAELDSLGKAGEVFNRFYQSEQNRRGNEQLQLSKNADARAGASAATELADKKGRADAAVALFQQRNPNATPAELEAVRRGVIDVNPDAKGAPAEVKLAQAMVNAGLAQDMRSGLEMALTKKTQDPGELHKEFVAAGIKNMAKPEDAVASADKVMETMGYSKNNGRWGMPAPAKTPKLQNVTDADIKATAQKYGITEDEVRKRLNLQ